MEANGLGKDVEEALNQEKELAARNPVFQLVDPATKPTSQANTEALRMKQLQRASEVLQLQLSVVHQMQEQLAQNMQPAVKPEANNQDRLRMVRHELDAAEALANGFGGIGRPMSPFHENSEPLALDRYNSTTYYRAVGPVADGGAVAEDSQYPGYGYPAAFHPYYHNQPHQQPHQSQHPDLLPFYGMNNILQNSTSPRPRGH
jgi:hypothetical protein